LGAVVVFTLCVLEVTQTHIHIHIHTLTPWRVPRGGGLEGRHAHGELEAHGGGGEEYGSCVRENDGCRDSRAMVWGLQEFRMAAIGKFAFGDRTIPIHARTLGPQRGDPNVMGVYYGTVQSAVWCTLTRPPLVRTHTSNPAFPTGGGLGGFVSKFSCCGGCWTS
jgi:hypothetical protein